MHTGSPDQGGEPAGNVTGGPIWCLLILSGSLAGRFFKIVYKLGKMPLFNGETGVEIK